MDSIDILWAQYTNTKLQSPRNRFNSVRKQDNPTPEDGKKGPETLHFLPEKIRITSGCYSYRAITCCVHDEARQTADRLGGK